MKWQPLIELAGTDNTDQAACVIGIFELSNRITRKIEMNHDHDKERIKDEELRLNKERSGMSETHEEWFVYGFPDEGALGKHEWEDK